MVETFPQEVNPMKNLKRLLVVGLALGLVGGGTALALKNTKEMKVAKADDLETYIPMESAFFTNWTNTVNTFWFGRMVLVYKKT